MATTSTDTMLGLLDRAKEIVGGSRNKAYGSPEQNHRRTATLWNAYLQNIIGVRPLDARDVCSLNILQKISRDLHWRQTDNMLDIAGYAANGEACCPPVYDYDLGKTPNGT